MAIDDVKQLRRSKFEDVFVKIRDELIEHFSNEGMPPEAIEWYQNVRSFFYSTKKLANESKELGL